MSTSPTRLPLLTASEKEENLLEMTNAAALMNMSEEAKRAMELLGEAMISVCFKYDANFRDLEELHKVSAGYELMERVCFLL